MKRFLITAAAVAGLIIGAIALAEDATFTTLRPQTTDLASSPALQARMARALADLQAAGLTNGLLIAGSVTNATTDANVTNSIGLANTNRLAVYDAAASNFLASLTNQINSMSNFLATLTNQANQSSNLLWGIQTQCEHTSNYWAWTSNWFGGQSNFLASLTNQANAVSNFQAAITNSQNNISNKLSAGIYTTNSSWTGVAQYQMTRTNNTTQYTAGDVMCDENTNVFRFIVARANAGTGWILGADCVTSANQTVKPYHELWLFSTVPTMQGDNVAWEPTFANLTNRVGVITFNVFAAADAGAGSSGNGILRATLANPLAFQCAAGTNVLYGVAIDRTAYTPIANEVLDWRLTIKQD